jgi:hypothetical protein
MVEADELRALVDGVDPRSGVELMPGLREDGERVRSDVLGAEVGVGAVGALLTESAVRGLPSP